MCFRVAARALLFENASPGQPVPVKRCLITITASTLLNPSASSETIHVFMCRDARAMYSCEAEHSHELSFPQGAHFTNGKRIYCK